MTMKTPNPSILLFAVVLQAVTSIRIVQVKVPSMVVAGQRAQLECHYREEGDTLYSLKFWRGDKEFYQYVPPHRKHFPTTGVTVNWTATTYLNDVNGVAGQEVVVLDRVGLNTAGVYKCEVMADLNFQTEFREANMTVIYAPDGPPRITPGLGLDISNITEGQRVSFNCSAPPASPPPMITWLINGRHVDPSWVKSFSPVFHRNLAQATSTLEFLVNRQLVSSGRPIEVICIATQGAQSTYSRSASLILTPRQHPPSFWGRIFSSHGTWVHASSSSQFYLLLLQLVCLFLASAQLTTCSC